MKRSRILAIFGLILFAVNLGTLVSQQLANRVPGIPEVKVGADTYVTIESNGLPVWTLEADANDAAAKAAYLSDIAKGSGKSHDFDNITLSKEPDPGLSCIYRVSSDDETVVVEFLVQDGKATYGREFKYPVGVTSKEVSEAIQKEVQETKERAKQ